MHHDHDKSKITIRIHRPAAMLVLGLAAIAGFYFFFQSRAPVSPGGLGLLLLGLVGALGVVMLARDLPGKLFRHLHGLPAAEPHSHSNLETEGLTIDWAGFYDLFVSALFVGQERKLRDETLALGAIRPGEKVLDVGCGTGTLAIAAARKFGPDVQVYGSDAAPEMIARAREKAAKAGVQVHFQPGLAEALDFPDGSFDLVTNSFFMHHLPGELKSRALAEMLRVLKPGGRLLVIEFEPPKGGLRKFLFSILIGGMMQIDNRTLSPLLTAAGFVGLESGPSASGFAAYVKAHKPASP